MHTQHNHARLSSLQPRPSQRSSPRRCEHHATWYAYARCRLAAPKHAAESRLGRDSVCEQRVRAFATETRSLPKQRNLVQATVGGAAAVPARAAHGDAAKELPRAASGSRCCKLSAGRTRLMPMTPSTGQSLRPHHTCRSRFLPCSIARQRYPSAAPPHVSQSAEAADALCEH